MPSKHRKTHSSQVTRNGGRLDVVAIRCSRRGHMRGAQLSLNDTGKDATGRISEIIAIAI